MRHMRMRDRTYKCADCGEVLDISLLRDPQSVMRRERHAELRTLLLDGEEIHTCVLT